MKTKHANLAMGMICCVLMLSCKKERDPTNEQTSTGNDIAKFSSIKQMKAEEDRTIAFTNLSPVEKAGFWNYHLSTQMGTLNKLQQVLVKEIMSKMTPAIFDPNTNDNSVFTSLIVPQWLEKSEPVIGKRKIIDLFYFIEGLHETNVHRNSSDDENSSTSDDIQAAVEYMPPYSDNAAPCMCNLGSSYTCVKNVYHAGTDGAWAETTYGNCSHNDNSCKKSGGCGFAGFWPCNGNACSY